MRYKQSGKPGAWYTDFEMARELDKHLQIMVVTAIILGRRKLLTTHSKPITNPQVTLLSWPD